MNGQSEQATKAGLVVSVSDYNGKPTLRLGKGANDAFPFSFQLGKAKLILACIDDIRSFVTAQENAAKAAELAKAEKIGTGVVLAAPALSVAQLQKQLETLQAQLASVTAKSSPEAILHSIAKKPSKA
jgi:hypothetical protein